jgi:hypothetical protein
MTYGGRPSGLVSAVARDPFVHGDAVAVRDHDRNALEARRQELEPLPGDWWVAEQDHALVVEGVPGDLGDDVRSAWSATGCWKAITGVSLQEV